MSYNALLIKYQFLREQHNKCFRSAGIKNTFNDVPLAAEFKGNIPERQVRRDSLSYSEAITALSGALSAPLHFVVLHYHVCSSCTLNGK